MAFHEISRAASHQGRAQLTQTISASLLRTGTINVRLSKDLYEEIGCPKAVRVMAGSGDDEGKALLIPMRNKVSGTRAVIKTTRAVGFSGASFGMRSQRPSPTKHLPFEITRDGLVVDLRPLRSAALSGFPRAA